MIGYHYTSLANWRKIQKEGLIPYPINKKELHSYFKEYPMGIWTWEQNMKGKSHMGSLFWQLHTKRSPKLVKLKYSFEIKDTLYYKEKQPVVMYHHGGTDPNSRTEGYRWHEQAKARIVTKRIPPEQITLVGEYDLVKLLA